MNENEWLANLKEGDEVVITDYSIEYDRIAIVSRLTATQVVVGKEKFKKSDGRRIGDGGGWRSIWIVPPTEERKRAIEKYALIRKLSGFKYQNLKLETLREILNLIAQEKE